MKKWNKRIILLLILAFTMGILAGCSSDDITFEGISNKKLNKDLVKLRGLLLESWQDKEYKEDSIDKILDKINDEKYQEKLSEVEIQLINSINDVKDDVKYELNNNKGIINSETLDEISWLLQVESRTK